LVLYQARWRNVSRRCHAAVLLSKILNIHLETESIKQRSALMQFVPISGVLPPLYSMGLSYFQ
jgi:hypothetical protein